MWYRLILGPAIFTLQMSPAQGASSLRLVSLPLTQNAVAVCKVVHPSFPSKINLNDRVPSFA